MLLLFLENNFSCFRRLRSTCTSQQERYFPHHLLTKRPLGGQPIDLCGLWRETILNFCLGCVTKLVQTSWAFCTFNPVKTSLWRSTYSEHHHSREHIGNIDESLKLSSITSLMHQFYIEHRKHWWIFDVTSRLHLCFQCFSKLKPTMFHLLHINDSSMKPRWIIIERIINHCWRNSCAYMLYGWIQRSKITNSSYQITILNHIEQKYWQKFDLASKKNNNLNFDQKNFDCYSQNWFLCVQNTFLGRIVWQFIFFSDFDQKNFSWCSRNWILRV